MSIIQNLVELCNAYAGARGLSKSRVSTLVFNDGKKLEQLETGADITVGRWEESVNWLDTNWPEGAVWPEGLPRPSLLPAVNTPIPEEAA